MGIRVKLLTILLTLIFSTSSIGQPKLKYENLGDFKLESGKVIKNCKIAYRVYGKINKDKSNIIIFPTGFGGKSEHLSSLIGKNLLINDKEYSVFAIDALGNGNSSSPSNSLDQPGKAFPKFTLRDMVVSQYQLLTKKLSIQHVFGIIGGSMGGMQVFQWIVTYPEFMDKAVSYVGSPKLSSYDLLLWYTQLLTIEEAQVYGIPEQSIMQIIAAIQTLVMHTPQYRVRETKPNDFQDFITTTSQNYSDIFIADDWASQLRAMMEHDITAPYFGFLEGAAEQVKTDVFIIVAKHDHIVNPASALEFAYLINAKTLELDSDCGHLAVGCELEKVSKAIRNFWKTE